MNENVKHYLKCLILSFGWVLQLKRIRSFVMVKLSNSIFKWNSIFIFDMNHCRSGGEEFKARSRRQDTNYHYGHERADEDSRTQQTRNIWTNPVSCFSPLRVLLANNSSKEISTRPVPWHLVTTVTRNNQINTIVRNCTANILLEAALCFTRSVYMPICL